VFVSYLAFNLDNLRGMLWRNGMENIPAGTSVRFGSFRAGMMQLVSKYIQLWSLVLGHRCSLVVTQWEAVNDSILAKAGVSVKRLKGVKAYPVLVGEIGWSAGVSACTHPCHAGQSAG
jgi:hypothetical protein